MTRERGTRLASSGSVRVRLAGWHTSLSAALGLLAVACGGQSKLERDADPDAHAGDGGSSGSASTGGSGARATGGSGARSTGGESGRATGGDGGSGNSAGDGSGGDTGGSAGSGASSGLGGSAGSGGTPIDLGCKNPQPVSNFDGTPTGFVGCDGNFVHRPERRDCSSRVPRPDVILEPLDGGFGCSTDADCSHQLYGHCVASYGPMGIRTGECIAGCLRDEDCAPGRVCLCGDPVGRCVTASCTTNADCGELLCVSSPAPSPCGGMYQVPFTCQTPEDLCRGLGDCAPIPYFSACQTINGKRECNDNGACGRPFLVDGEARLAELVEGECGWSSDQAPNVASLDRATRAALAEHFARIGLMEHASVAAFARFTLELLALGAPSALVVDAQRALGDEVRHTTLCFGLASAYAGHALGPGPLSAAGALDAMSFEEIVARAISEACIGETLAAVEAAEAAEHATDPAVRSVLRRIAEDEKRHAELGWLFFAWALEHAPLATRARLRAHCARAIASVRAERPVRADSSNTSRARRLLEHGVLTSELRHETRQAAIEELVAPLAAALGEHAERRAA